MKAKKIQIALIVATNGEAALMATRALNKKYCFVVTLHVNSTTELLFSWTFFGCRFVLDHIRFEEEKKKKEDGVDG